MSLSERAKCEFGESLNKLPEGGFKRYTNSLEYCIDLVAVLCVEVLFPSTAENGSVSLLNEVLKCFYFDNAEDIKKAIPGSDVRNVHACGTGLSIYLDMGENIPKFLYYIAILLRIVAKKYQRLQEPERAKKAAVTAALYIQACADLLKQRKEIAAAQLDSVLPTLLFDHGPVPDKYSYNYNIGAAVENEYDLTERSIERLGRKIKALIEEVSEKEEGI